MLKITEDCKKRGHRGVNQDINKGRRMNLHCLYFDPHFFLLNG